MKRTRIIACVCIIVLIVSVFCACEITFGETPETTTTTTTQSTTTTAEELSEQTTTTDTTVNKVETDSLDTILNLIKNFPLGTAGSTAKAVNIANRLVNFTEHSGFDVDEVKKDYANFLDTLSDTQKLLYDENLAEIDFFARKIIDGEKFSELSLSDYQAKPEKDGRFSSSDYQVVYDVISE